MRLKRCRTKQEHFATNESIHTQYALSRFFNAPGPPRQPLLRPSHKQAPALRSISTHRTCLQDLDSPAAAAAAAPM
eukprot:1141722-Pelagomonas_calceolata.AAC.4